MIAYTVLKQLLLPPGLLLVLMAVAFFLVRGRLGRLLLLLAWGLLAVMSLPVLADLLIESLERYPPLSLADARRSGAEAIVVLGAGVYADAAEYGGTTVDERSMARSRYAARLHRQTGLPIYVTGGSGERAPGPAMRRFLQQELGAPVAGLEDASRNTRENATLTAPILAAAHVGRVLLVTDAWHMPRSVDAFEQAGIEVVPAPTCFLSDGHRLPAELGGSGRDWRDWLPQAKALRGSFYAIHELLGALYYDLRAWLAPTAPQAEAVGA